MRPCHRLIRRLILAALLAGAVAISAPAGAVAQATPPAPARFVTDQAGFLSAPTVAELDQRLEAYQKATGHQVLLWIGHTTGGEVIETWAVRAFAAWKVGRSGLDDGVVLFVLADDRKLRIEVGYGLEGVLPDVRAARIIREQITPRLQAGDRDGAARAGVGAILGALGGETGAPSAAAPPEDARPHLGLGELLLLGIVGLLVLGFLVTHPGLALLMLTNLGSGGRGFGGGGGGSGSGFGGGGGFSGGGGRSGGGGASGSW